MSFTGSVVLITGGAQGIGFGVAQHFTSLGARVVLLDMLEDKLKEAVVQLEGASYHVINVSKEEDWAAAVSGVIATHGKIDVLVQAAGITGRTGIKTHEVDPANWDAVFAVNSRGIFLGCRAVLPSMVAAGYGRIVNIASVAGKEGNAGMAAYSASKGAVIALTKCIGKEYAELGITCNALAPAVVRTAMVDAMPAEQVKYMTGERCKRHGCGQYELLLFVLADMSSLVYKDSHASLLEKPPLVLQNTRHAYFAHDTADKIPMKRCGLISEIANLAAFIASKECSFTTGFTFDATGGRAVY